MKKILLCIFLLCSAHNLMAATSYRSDPGATIVVNEFGNCISVTNNSPNSFFIPTKTSAEWNAFLSKPPTNVTFSACGPVVNCTGAWSTCVAGTKTFNVTLPAANGGTACAYANGATATCPINCVGAWGACFANKRTYAVTTPASNGGALCPVTNGTQELCATGPKTPVSAVAVPYPKGTGGALTLTADTGGAASCNRLVTVSTIGGGAINVNLPIYGYGDCGSCNPGCHYSNRSIVFTPGLPSSANSAYLDSGGNSLWNAQTVFYDGARTITIGQNGGTTVMNPRWCNASNVVDVSVKSCQKCTTNRSTGKQTCVPSSLCCSSGSGRNRTAIKCPAVYGCTSPGFVISW